MKKMPAILEALRSRPGMYLGHDSLPLLAAYLNGYLRGGGEGCEEIVEMLAGFQLFVREKYLVSSDHGWCDIIQFYEKRESKAFSRFFELLDDYLAGC